MMSEQYALVTGSSKGIGKAIAGQLASRGLNLLLVARSAPLLKETAQELSSRYGIRVYYLPVDLSRAGAAADVHQWCIDNRYEVSVLVNNAGYGLSGPPERFTVKEWSNMLHLNMIALTELCMLFIPMLQRQYEAYILNVASTAAYQAVPGLNLYAASKVFVLNFSRALKYELSHTSVSVTCICPGPVDTDFPIRAQLGESVVKKGKGITIKPERLAKIAVDAMFKRKTEVIPGLANKATAFLTRIVPKKLTEKIAAGIYFR